jgi:ABC-2 type transport system ATP-binding protein
MTNIAITCRDLRKTYDNKVDALRGIDLEVRAGECFGLLGPNGAGKTTAIEILDGLLDASSGEVTVFGLNWRQHQSQLREWIGTSLQETRLAEKLTVRETIDLFASFYNNPNRTDSILDQLHLREKANSWVGRLSGGQRQRLAVALALVANPRILFLDEPTTGLDPQSRRQLWEIIRQFQANGGTVLLTTHYMDEAERLCDRLAIIDCGEVIASGSPSELIEKLGGTHIIEFAIDRDCDAGSLDPWRKLPGVDAARLVNGYVSLNVQKPHVTIPALLDAIRQRHFALQHLNTRQASLEDVFVQLTGRRLRED